MKYIFLIMFLVCTSCASTLDNQFISSEKENVAISKEQVINMMKELKKPDEEVARMNNFFESWEMKLNSVGSGGK